MKTVLLALALISVAPLVHAQPQPGYPDDYGRQHREGEGDWRRREEFRDEEHRREEWRRAHCVRDYQGQEFCRH